MYLSVYECFCGGGGSQTRFRYENNILQLHDRLFDLIKSFVERLPDFLDRLMEQTLEVASLLCLAVPTVPVCQNVTRYSHRIENTLKGAVESVRCMTLMDINSKCLKVPFISIPRHPHPHPFFFSSSSQNLAVLVLLFFFFLFCSPHLRC